MQETGPGITSFVEHHNICVCIKGAAQITSIIKSHSSARAFGGDLHTLTPAH